jgi:hypothetical protein
MAYDSAGLRAVVGAQSRIWMLDTVDAVATAVGTDYITGGAASTSNPQMANQGMQIGDVVIVRVVGALPGRGEAPAACTDGAFCMVTGIDADGNVTITEM